MKGGSPSYDNILSLMFIKIVRINILLPVLVKNSDIGETQKVYLLDDIRSIFNHQLLDSRNEQIVDVVMIEILIS